MSIRTLVNYFDQPERKLFLDISEIARKIISLLNGHAIYYCPQIEIEGAKTPVYGMLEQRSRKEAYAPEMGVDNYVHFRAGLPNKLKRLVLCKELIHILDPECYLTNTPTDVTSLVVNVSRPKGMQEADAKQAMHDRLAITMAVGILFPLSIRNQFMDNFKKGKISAASLADAIGIPDQYVDSVMEESWPEFYSTTLETAEAEFA